MSQKIVWIPQVGEVVLAKRKDSKTMRLSVSAAGKVRVGMPVWVPYTAGISFVQSRSDWVNQHLSTHQTKSLADGERIGKSFRLNYTHSPQAARTTTRLSNQNLNITSPLPLSSRTVQAAATRASQRALKLEAEKLLPDRLAQLASKNCFTYKSIRIKKLVSRWGSCSSDKVITLNYFLMQLPWQLIDYVLVHELVHTRHLNHSPAFWQEFESVYPGAKNSRRLIKAYRPIINSVA
jgi:predicted metal-dependent hydrolase